MQMQRLQSALSSLSQSNAPQDLSAEEPEAVPHSLRQEGRENQILDTDAQVVLIANRRNVNRGLTVATPAILEGFPGRPRDSLTDDCIPMTNEKTCGATDERSGRADERADAAPGGRQPQLVFARVRALDVDLYNRLSTAGSLCVRPIRSSENATSRHRFCLAPDLNVDGRLDVLGDGRTRPGLTILAEIFKQVGWIRGRALVAKIRCILRWPAKRRRAGVRRAEFKAALSCARRE